MSVGTTTSYSALDTEAPKFNAVHAASGSPDYSRNPIHSLPDRAPSAIPKEPEPWWAIFLPWRRLPEEQR